MMNRFDSSISLSGLFSGANKKPTLILLLTPILLTALKYYGSKQFYLDNLQSFLTAGNPEWAAALYVFASSFVLFGLITAPQKDWEELAEAVKQNIDLGISTDIANNVVPKNSDLEPDQVAAEKEPTHGES